MLMTATVRYKVWAQGHASAGKPSLRLAFGMGMAAHSSSWQQAPLRRVVLSAAPRPRGVPTRGPECPADAEACAGDAVDAPAAATTSGPRSPFELACGMHVCPDSV